MRRARAARRAAAARSPFRFSLRRAVLDPLADHVDRRRRKVGSAVGHARADRLRAVELLDEEAPVGVAGNHTYQVRVLGTVDVDQVSSAEAGIEPKSLLRPCTAVAAGNGTVHVKDIRLDGIKRWCEP